MSVSEVTRRWLALAAMALAMLTIGLDMTVLTVALPTLAVDLDAGAGALQWFSTAYTLALAALMLPAGALGDRIGRKPVLLAALVLFGVASVGCAWSASAGQLIAARVVLGIAAAAMIPLTLAVLPVLFADRGERARAMSIWVTSSALGLPLGPVLGGWLVDNYWWGSVFLINVPMVMVGTIAVAMWVPDSRDPVRRPMDLPGVGLSALAMLAVTYGFIRCGEEGWGSVAGLASLAAGLLVLAAFVFQQRTTVSPLIDAALFAKPGFRWGAAFSVLITFAMFGMLFTVPQYFQEVLGADALGSGLRLLPMIAGIVVGARAGARLSAALGTRAVLVAGIAALAVGLALGAATRIDSSYWFAACWIAVAGAGMGAATPVAMAIAIDDLDVARAGVGSALLQALRQVAGTLGVAVLGTVLITRYRAELGPWNIAPYDAGVSSAVAVARARGEVAALAQAQSAFLAGMSLMLWVCAAVCVGAALLAWRVLPRRAARAEGIVQTADGPESTHVG